MIKHTEIIKNPVDGHDHPLLPFEVKNPADSEIISFGGSYEKCEVINKDGKSYLRTPIWANNPSLIKVTVLI